MKRKPCPECGGEGTPNTPQGVILDPDRHYLRCVECFWVYSVPRRGDGTARRERAPRMVAP